MAQYTKLKSDNGRPNFAYILLTNVNAKGYSGFTPDYYLYKVSEFEQAYEQLQKEIAKGVLYATLNAVVKHADGYRTVPFMGEKDGKVQYLEYAEIGLHCYWYVRCGEWLNQRKDI